MEDLVETRFDVIVCGTGVAESIAAAAAAKAGRSVIHVDRNNFYGGSQASLTLQEFETLAQTINSPDEDTVTPNELSTDGEQFTIHVQSDMYKSIRKEYDCFSWKRFPLMPTVLPNVDDVDVSNLEPPVDVLDQSRRFNIDLAPQLLYSRGAMVETLVSSDIGRYLEFKVLERLFIVSEDHKWEKVPCSKEDVFGNRALSLVEKRLLMRFLQWCLEYETNENDYKAFADRPFHEFLTHRQLPTKLQAVVIHAIALSLDPNVKTIEGLHLIRDHLKSLGRYGETAFLVPLYGSSEIPQAFCRVCAIYGGIYMLDTCPSAFHFVRDNADSDTSTTSSYRFDGVTMKNQQRLTASNLVASQLYLRPEDLIAANADGATDETNAVAAIYRMVVILQGASKPFPEVSLGLGIVPPGIFGNMSSAVAVLQMDANASVCPQDAVLVHLTGNNADDVDSVARSLFRFPDQQETWLENDERPIVRVSVSYRHRPVTAASTQVSPNVWLCPGPSARWDPEIQVLSARQWFTSTFAQESFLSRGPNEIVDESA